MSDIPKIRVLLADDHPLMREGIRRVLEQAADITIVGEADDGNQAVEFAGRLQPDVVLCDIRLPGIGGTEVVRRVKDHSPNTRLLVLSAYDDDEYIFETIAAGAAGYLLKTMDVRELPDAIRRADSGQMVLYPPAAEKLARMLGANAQPAEKRESLTVRELEVLALAVRGLRNKDIARRLSLSVRTVEGHFSRILVKLSVSSRTAAVREALSKGLVDPAEGEHKEGTRM